MSLYWEHLVMTCSSISGSIIYGQKNVKFFVLVLGQAYHNGQFLFLLLPHFKVMTAKDMDFNLSCKAIYP